MLQLCANDMKYTGNLILTCPTGSIVNDQNKNKFGFPCTVSMTIAYLLKSEVAFKTILFLLRKK